MMAEEDCILEVRITLGATTVEEGDMMGEVETMVVEEMMAVEEMIEQIEMIEL